MLPRSFKEGEKALKNPDTRFRQRYLDLMVNEGVRKTFEAR